MRPAMIDLLALVFAARNVGTAATTTWMSDAGVGNISLPDELKSARPHMAVSEAQGWLRALLHGGRYLEWGSGSTTMLASWLAVERPRLGTHRIPTEITSIESDRAFMVRVRGGSRYTRLAEQSGVLTYLHGDIGPTGRWGAPIGWLAANTSLQDARASAYVQAVGEERCCFDFILIDCRFRAACALHALRLIAPGGIILMHDWWHYGHKYPGVLPWFHIVSAHSKSSRGNAEPRDNVTQDVTAGYLVRLVPRHHSLRAARAGSDHYWQALHNESRSPL